MECSSLPILFDDLGMASTLDIDAQKDARDGRCLILPASYFKPVVGPMESAEESEGSCGSTGLPWFFLSIAGIVTPFGL